MTQTDIWTKTQRERERETDRSANKQTERENKSQTGVYTEKYIEPHTGRPLHKDRKIKEQTQMNKLTEVLSTLASTNLLKCQQKTSLDNHETSYKFLTITFV